MRVYQFNPENGFYAGEMFEDNEMLKYVEGVTTIAPPPYGPGQVPVFDPDRQAWDTMPVTLPRRKIHHVH